MNFKAIPLQELAVLISSELQKEGFTAILVGGSVVSLYTDNKYQSRDLDFISNADYESLVRTLARLGFTPKGKDFCHPECFWTIEFPKGPLAIGNQLSIQAEGELDIQKHKLSLLSPTQCVMDRLAWFYFSNDRQCLDQAVAVAKEQPISIEKVRNWSEKENELEKFNVFENRLRQAIGG